MSSHLWKAYYEDDIDAFRQLLEAPATGVRNHSKAGTGAFVGSPGGAVLGASPTLLHKIRKTSGQGVGGSSTNTVALSKTDINWRDANGLTILHHASSSTSTNAAAFALALIEQPFIDLHLQDLENGWTALHRAFYFGNISIARMILEREAGGMLGARVGLVHPTVPLIKIKDREGQGPLDLYADTIRDRTLRPDAFDNTYAGSVNSDDNEDPDEVLAALDGYELDKLGGDEMYTFGSNRNLTLGFGDEDDRQFPERITLRRPEHLLRRFYKTWQESVADDSNEVGKVDASSIPVEDIPWIIRTRPLVIRKVHMAKLHTAVLTNDPESNLYICGHGQGGRLGLGDERTRFTFACVEGGAIAGKRIATVALGQNHTLALSEDGEIFSWGSNGYGQLGYSLPRSAAMDEDPVSTLPRQIFGPLKRESIAGIAASRIHSVAFTGSSLYTFGKNDGQLGIVDSDARSLEVQVIPRKVAASLFTSSIESVSAIDKATICLLENHDVWVFANYGYAKVSFPLEGFTNYFLKQSFLVTSYEKSPNRIVKVTSAGDTVCALSSRGEIFTISISRHDNQASSSTTNPAKIRSAITQPQCIWSLKRGNMAARDVGVDADGSIVLATEEGSVWKRTKRANLKDASSGGIGDYKPKDYKFSRIPGLTRVLSVSASAYGAYAAIRRDCDVTKTQIVVEAPTLHKDIHALSPLRMLLQQSRPGEDDDTRLRFWQSLKPPDPIQALKQTILTSKDVEEDLRHICEQLMADTSSKYDAIVSTTTSDIQIPIHRFLLTGRSKVLRRGFRDLCETSTFTIPDLAISELDQQGRVVLKFQGLDFLTVVDFVLYLYTDGIAEFWHIRDAKEKAFRYRLIRTEMMKIAARLDLSRLEPAVRQMIEPKPSLDIDFVIAFNDPAFFYDGDVTIQLDDGQVDAHSALVCARCPFFEGLFGGRAGGRWLAGRDGDDEKITVDLAHISSRTFKLVLQHIYSDTSATMFDHIVCADLDEFLDIVLDVLSAANELMLDRLSQICQSVIGRYVNARNVCWLLNAISPSSVHEFKHAGLEYLCLNLEAMLLGHHLNELDEDLLQDLDEVVIQNQLDCMPFAKSGRAELELHERHPELAGIIDRNRQAKIDAIRLRSKIQDLQTFKPGSLDDGADLSPLQTKSRRRSSGVAKADHDRPSLRAKASAKDMMFAMDEEIDTGTRSPSQSPAIRPMSTPKLEAIQAASPEDDQWYDSRGRLVASPSIAAQRSPMQTAQPASLTLGTPRTPRSPMLGGKTPPSSGKPWTLQPLPSARTDLKDIMAQASSSQTSFLSQGLASSRNASLHSPDAASSLPGPKLSQKDRKKLQHQQPISFNDAQSPQPPSASKGSPWQTVTAQKVPSLKDVIGAQDTASPKAPVMGRSSTTPQLTMRQTVANSKAQPSPKSGISPGGQPSLQQRSVSDGRVLSPGSPVQPRPSLKVQASSPRPQPQPISVSNSKPIPHSIRHQPRPVEATLQLAMSDIVAQQQAEKDVIREAVAKRDLQDIQAEQEFQEWWDKESARVQEAEQKTAAPSKASKKGRIRGGKGGKGAKGKAEAGSA